MPPLQLAAAAVLAVLLGGGGGASAADDPRSGAYQWGAVLTDETATQRTSAPIPVPGDAPFSEIALGENFLCGLVANGTAQCVGGNNAGQLGRGFSAATGSSEMLPVVNGSAYDSIAASQWASVVCAIRAANASLECWGASARRAGLGRSAAAPHNGLCTCCCRSPPCCALTLEPPARLQVSQGTSLSRRPTPWPCLLPQCPWCPASNGRQSRWASTLCAASRRRQRGACCALGGCAGRHAWGTQVPGGCRRLRGVCSQPCLMEPLFAETTHLERWGEG